jgi:16S rRNA G966 N2-methylase RsmD
LNQINARKQDVFAYINQCDSQFDIIFADPPYAISRIPEMIRQILEKPLLKSNALLIIEHSTLVDVSHEVGFVESRIYGQSSFSFFERK